VTTVVYRNENIRDKSPSSHNLNTDDLWKINDKTKTRHNGHNGGNDVLSASI
jgi:hypothetical protein